MLLGDAAEILRCQVERQRVEPGCPEGPLPGQRMACREVMLENIDPCGFVDVNAAPLAIVRMSARAEKFLLVSSDILMVAIGVRESLGSVGFVVEALPAFVGRPAIPGHSLYVIRTNARPIDPVWLFYYLRQSRNTTLAALPAGKRIGLRELARLEVPEPAKSDVAAIKALHEERLESWQTMLEERKRMMEADGRIRALLSLAPSGCR